MQLPFHLQGVGTTVLRAYPPYHRRNSIAGSPPTVPEKALGWFPRKATVGSKRQREYLREMGYKVNRDDDNNGDGATKQDALPLTPPFFWRLRRK